MKGYYIGFNDFYKSEYMIDRNNPKQDFIIVHAIGTWQYYKIPKALIKSKDDKRRIVYIKLDQINIGQYLHNK